MTFDTRIRSHVRRARIQEQRRHHADDLICAAAKTQLTRQNVGGAAERCLPQTMANDRDTRTSEAVIVWSEDSADFRLGIERSKEIAADTCPANTFSGVTIDESQRVLREYRQTRERRRRASEVIEVGIARREGADATLQSMEMSAGFDSGRHVYELVHVTVRYVSISTAFTTLKIAELAPMPMPTVRRAMHVKSRSPEQRARTIADVLFQIVQEARAQGIAVLLLNVIEIADASRARRAASERVDLSAMYDSTWRSKSNRNSSSISSSTAVRLINARNRSIQSLSMVSSVGFEYPTDCGRCKLPPSLGPGFQLRTSSACQFVGLGAPVVLGGAPSRLNPPAPFETVQRGIERTLPHLKSVARHLVGGAPRSPSRVAAPAQPPSR